MVYVKVAGAGEIPAGSMKHVEVMGTELCIINAGGTFYATADRCPHMSAPLSLGQLNGTVLTCPLHFSRYDIRTGTNLSGPVETHIEGIDMIPSAVTSYVLRIAAIMAAVKTYDLQTFPVRVEKGEVLADL